MPNTAFLDLPGEIILRIVECAHFASLKVLRQSCRTLQQMVEPLLFDTVRIYPHMHRVEQAINISLQPRLRQHVKCLIYDNRYIGLVDFIIKRIESTYSSRVSAEEKACMLDQARKFKKSTLEHRRDEDIELLLLHDVVRNLPNLENIACTENRYGIGGDFNAIDIDLLPSLYRELRRTTCGAHPDFDLESGDYIFPKLKQTAARILVASARAGSGRLTSFCINNGVWESIANFEQGGKHIDMLTPLISNLHDLEISAELDDDFQREFLMQNLGDVLVLATSLRVLHLDFGTNAAAPENLFELDPDEELPKSNLACILHARMSPFEPASWPQRLEILSLGQLTCNKSDFLSLLLRLRHNLKVLVLSNLTLVPQQLLVSEGEYKAECLVALMHDLHRHLHLDKVYLRGVFSNTRAQMWRFYAGDNLSDYYLWRDTAATASLLEDYILHKAECPIDGLVIQDGNNDMTEDQYNAHIHLNDKSFKIDGEYFALARAIEEVENDLDDQNTTDEAESITPTGDEW